MFEARFNEIDNRLEIFNVSQYPDEINAPVKMEIEPKKYDKIFTELGLNVLMPINDGEDFIYTYVGTSVAKGNLYSFDSLIGRSFGDVYPYFKEHFYPIFREVLKTGDRQDIFVYFYEGKELQIGIDLKVLLNNDEIFFFMENKTEIYELQTREKNNFELSTLPKSIVQNNRIVKINRAHELLTNVSIEDANKLTFDDFNKHKIVYNDTGLVLNYSQIMEKVLSNEYPQITYNMVVDTYENPRRLQGLARHITYQGAPAIEFTVLRELEEFDAELDEFTQGKMDLIQKISKTAFMFYDVTDKSSTWGRSLEYILEGPITSDDLDGLRYKIFTEDSIGQLKEIKNKIKNEESVIEGEIKIKTFKDNTKYLRYNLKPLYQDGKIVKWLQILTDITEEVMKNTELNTLKDVVDDVQEATSISVFFMNNDGKYYWTPETYKIIEREARPNDSDYHILADLINEEELAKYNELISGLAPNEFLGTNIFTLYLESGKTKIVEMNARKIYDKFGNFVRRVEYCRDITEDYLTRQELLSLNATVEDVQEAASVSIHYKKANGEHIWTPETYKLIERDPLPEDKNNHIILDLASEEDQEKFNNLFDSLKPNEFLGAHELSITCENGKVKHLQVDSKKLYDNDGNFIQKSGYAMEITEEVLKNKELERLNATVEDVQEAAAISVHYMDAEGIHHWTPATYRIIEREPRLEDKYTNIITDLASPEDQKLHKEMWDKLKPNEFLGAHDLKITLENGKVKDLQVDTRKFYDKEGNFIQQSAYAMDVTEARKHERELIKADAEKTVLIKEVHHRVKNNLQVISSLISLEERFKTDSDIIIDITKSRINALALIHETIYNEEDMNYINVKYFIGEFDEKLKSLATYPDINFINEIDDWTLPVNAVTPLVLMINELTTNSFKYAFKEDDVKEIFKSIHLYEDNGIKMAKFHYKDNGKGLDEGFDIDSSRSLGWTIIKSLAAQLDGEYELFNDNGFNFVLKFPILE